MAPSYANADAIAVGAETWILRGTTLSRYASPDNLYDRIAPQPLLGTIDNVAAFAGAGDGCVLLRDGTLTCYGAIDRNAGAEPVQIHLADVRTIAASERTACAIDARNVGWCWGEGHDGQLGPAHTKSYDYVGPTMIFPAATAVAVAASWTCAIQLDGHVACVGTWRDYATIDAFPRVIAGIEGAKAIALDDSFGCAVDRDDRVQCWVNLRYSNELDPAMSADSATPLAWDAPPKLALPIAPARPVLPHAIDELGHAVEPIPEDATCSDSYLYDPRAKACRAYPNGPYGAMGCSMGGGGYASFPVCLTGAYWNRCTCSCPTGRVFDGATRACVTPKTPKP